MTEKTKSKKGEMKSDNKAGRLVVIHPLEHIVICTLLLFLLLLHNVLQHLCTVISSLNGSALHYWR